MELDNILNLLWGEISILNLLPRDSHSNFKNMTNGAHLRKVLETQRQSLYFARNSILMSFLLEEAIAFYIDCLNKPQLSLTNHDNSPLI